MKKTILLSCMFAFVLNCFAYSSYSSDDSFGWLTFISIIMIIWGVLEIILFFKLWRMTNDVNELKKDHFNEIPFLQKSQLADFLRRNLILGNLDKVRQILLSNFISEVEKDYEVKRIQITNELYKANNYNYGEQAKVNKEVIEKLNKESIRPYVEGLVKHFRKIGEETPVYIQHLNTFNDFFTVFTDDDLTLKKQEENKE